MKNSVIKFVQILCIPIAIIWTVFTSPLAILSLIVWLFVIISYSEDNNPDAEFIKEVIQIFTLFNFWKGLFTKIV